MSATVRQTTSHFDELIVRVRGEYLEMPGLSLTIPQAQRLWAVEHSTCVQVFDSLVDARWLRRTRRGRFVRAD